jgi:hypothetical protein
MPLHKRPEAASGSWEPRHPLTYVPASQAGAVSIIPRVTSRSAAVAVLFDSSGTPPARNASARMGIALVILSWVMLWISWFAATAAQ